MNRKYTLISTAALLTLQSFGLMAAATAAASPAESLSERGLEITQAIQLDANQVLSMKPGQKIDITFPVIGRRSVVFEASTRGLDGSRYWHGRLAGNPLDRVFLKQEKAGFVGAIRFGSGQIAFRQGPDGQLTPSVAHAPVAGQAYAVRATTAKGIYDIQPNFAAIAQAPEGSEIALPLPDGKVEVAIVTRTKIDREGFVQIRAVSRMGGVGSPTVLTIGKDAVFGAVYVEGHEYQIITRNGRQQLIDPQGAGWSEPTGDDVAPVVEADFAWWNSWLKYTGGSNTSSGTSGTSSGSTTSGSSNSTGTGSGSGSSGSSTSGTSTGTSGGTSTTTSGTSSNLRPLPHGTVDTVITLLMTYGPSYVAHWGSESIARTRMSNFVELTNTIHANSGTGIEFKIVKWQKLNQPDDVLEEILPAMRDNTGAFSSLNALKKDSGAAMAVFIEPQNAASSTTNSCGLAYVPGSRARGLAAYRTDAPRLMYSTVKDGVYNNSSCSTMSLAHELGHNLGNTHDKANSSFPGVFSYSYGKGVEGVFGTVMAYIRPRLMTFSSPDLSCGTTQPQPCGSDTENVVATMLQTKSIVAALGPNAASQSLDGYQIGAGWLVNADGSPYLGAASITSMDPKVTCSTGSTGLYVCKMPDGVASVSVKVTASGRIASPSMGSIMLDPTVEKPITGTRFYLK